jgi:hypothetical protein
VARSPNDYLLCFLWNIDHRYCGPAEAPSIHKSLKATLPTAAYHQKPHHHAFKYTDCGNYRQHFRSLYFIPLYFQFVHGDSAIDAAVRLLPFVLVFVTISLLSGVFFLGSITSKCHSSCLRTISRTKTDSSWVLYAASAIFISVGGGLMYTVHINTASAKIYGYSILLAIGSGLSSQAGYAIAGIKITSKGWPTIDVQRSISAQNF